MLQTLYLSYEPIHSFSQSRETIPLNAKVMTEQKEKHKEII
jgi:hypothetical protein